MDNQVCSPSFTIDPNNKDQPASQVEWNVGDIKFISKAWHIVTANNKMRLHYEVLASRPDKTEPYTFVFGVQICEVLRFRTIRLSIHRMLDLSETFAGGMSIDHIIPKKYQFFIAKWKEIVPDQDKVMMNPQSDGGFIDKLWREQLLTDFVFKVKEQEFPVHKSILAAQSDVFRVMFNDEHNMQETITNTAEITDISPKAFQQFLEYIYIRKQPTYDKHTIDLYKAAHKYDIKELMDLCESLLSRYVYLYNAMDMLEFANLFNLSTIRKSAFEIIQRRVFPDDQLSPNFEHHPSIVKNLIDAKNERDKTINEAKSKYADELEALKKQVDNNNNELVPQ